MSPGSSQIIRDDNHNRGGNHNHVVGPINLNGTEMLLLKYAEIIFADFLLR